ncbi:MAG: response regulator [Candidatus Buchananbacteria bacterium]|nr:response regulator [Candidatus Buchananbacteria bacterium]
MAKKKILIVEDELPLRRALVDKLTREGFLILEAENGKVGLNLALTKKPDLILLDIIMPVMDGMTMLKKLRKDARGKNARVMILSNLSDVKKIHESIIQGSYDYLIKTDWKIEDVVTKINQYLQI